jgi:LysM repeat protein
MRRKPLALVLVGLMILSALMAGCRRSSAAPPLEELTTEEEAAAVMLEAQANTEEMQAAEEEAPATTEELTEAVADTETEAPEPTDEAETPLEPAVSTDPVETGVEEPATEPVTTVGTGATTHVVQPGENLFQISLRYATTVQAISQANNITNPGLIYLGQTLQIPEGSGTTAPATLPGQTCATVYVVQPGDNLFRIALSYDYSQFYLAQYNGLANPSMVYVGQQLCIP